MRYISSTKHKAQTQFEPINTEIEKYLKDKLDELSVFAAKVEIPAGGALPPGE